MNDTQSILNQCKVAMEKGVEAAKREFASVRTGKASPQMLDTVKVEMYGQHLAMNQCATVSAPEPRLLVVTPFDKGQIKAVEKAIRESNLGLDPAVQGSIIRVPLPSMNEQRRKELAKLVHKYAEDGRIAVRHARTHARDALKKLEGVGEDEVKRAEKELQALHDAEIAKIDAQMKAKEAELMEV
jgi:ribosome recycling factor